MLQKLAILGTCVGLVFFSTALGCKKQAGSAEDNNIDNQAIGKTFDDSEPAAGDRKPITGIDLNGLSDADKKRFESFADKFASPCGKPHSLRTSKNTDASCLKATFALRYLAQEIRIGLTDKEVVKWYGAAYRAEEPPVGFKLESSVPHKGPEDAVVVLVEFYDYGCPACKGFAPEIAAVQAAYPSDVAVYYKQFPLSGHKDSGPAAQAALAAAKQGKFFEMHEALFNNAPQHKLPSLKALAVGLGLDMAKFNTDYEAAEAVVAAEKAEGIAAKVQSTPTTYINGVRYGGLNGGEFLKIFVEQTIALKR